MHITSPSLVKHHHSSPQNTTLLLQRRLYFLTSPSPFHYIQNLPFPPTHFLAIFTLPGKPVTPTAFL